MSIDELFFEGISCYHSAIDDNMKITIFLKGYLDTMNSGNVQQYFQKILSENRSLKSIDLNLMKLNYASSTGIGIFSSLLMSCKKQNISLELCNVPAKIMDVINLLGFSAFFSIRG